MKTRKEIEADIARLQKELESAPDDQPNSGPMARVIEVPLDEVRSWLFGDAAPATDSEEDSSDDQEEQKEEPKEPAPRSRNKYFGGK